MASRCSPTHLEKGYPVVVAFLEGRGLGSWPRQLAFPSLSACWTPRALQERSLGGPRAYWPRCRSVCRQARAGPWQRAYTRTFWPARRHVSFECDAGGGARRARLFRVLGRRGWRAVRNGSRRVARCPRGKRRCGHLGGRECAGGFLSWGQRHCFPCGRHSGRRSVRVGGREGGHGGRGEKSS